MRTNRLFALTAVRSVVGHLILGDYDDLSVAPGGGRDDLRRAVDAYGPGLSRVPDRGFEFLDLLAVRDTGPAAFDVVVPLWTREEGISRLTLRLRLIEYPNFFQSEVAGLHIAEARPEAQQPIRYAPR